MPLALLFPLGSIRRVSSKASRSRSTRSTSYVALLAVPSGREQWAESIHMPEEGVVDRVVFRPRICAGLGSTAALHDFMRVLMFKQYEPSYSCALGELEQAGAHLRRARLRVPPPALEPLAFALLDWAAPPRTPHSASVSVLRLVAGVPSLISHGCVLTQSRPSRHCRTRKEPPLLQARILRPSVHSTTSDTSNPHNELDWGAAPSEAPSSHTTDAVQALRCTSRSAWITNACRANVHAHAEEPSPVAATHAALSPEPFATLPTRGVQMSQCLVFGLVTGWRAMICRK
ncbi:uncharacterized protein C8Q71DRAFT_726672 [Rhodofomes roseus]|uniref:Uncharacterized protein n=1 Tax=Rhodofomes roseus TaxID=34475 RepID=A0ABQ8K5L4_9APHY|nr:uncharacterized protein C8Q71DRAFT_726672 [Rhodofomes roseus]KAH9831809.1 hypothetical protein C8Q71DRAFT_726672 [Rhodofomes roseus]